MIDSLGRNIDYLRVSITDRCNLRCLYCMPTEGVQSIPHQQVMRYEEILRLCGIMAGLGVRKLKITGGEPLVRRGAVDFIAAAKRLPGIEQVTLTTNGQLLESALPALGKAGIDGINFSLDTLDAAAYAAMTRGGSLERVLSALDAAYAAGIRPLKVNCVLMRGLNEDAILPLAGIAREREIEVRFIELMPIGFARDQQPVPNAEVLARLTQAFGPPEPYRQRLGNGPACYYSFPAFAGRIGVIGAVSHGFCADCNRVRLTADGWLKLCLHYDLGCDLLTPLRAGADDQQLSRLIQDTLLRKPAAHCFGEQAREHTETRNMNAIGG